MKNSQIIALCLGLTLILFTCKGIGLTYESPENEFQLVEYAELGVAVKPMDCFEYAESVTGFSAEILRGIAATESHFRTGAIGDGGMSIGMFQLHSKWHDSRVEKWGEHDPVDPFESAVIAGYIMQENLDAFDGDLNLAIAAYKQGVTGVRENGVIQWYVDDVLNWRNNSEKVLSLFFFCGITESEELKDGYTGSRTHNSYQLDNPVAVQVSWRGRSGLPQERR